MKQISKNDIKNIQQNLIYPIYEDQEISKEIINRLGYDINQIVNKSFKEITKVYTLGQLPFKEIYFIGLGNSQTITTSQLRKAFYKISENLKEDICFNAIEATNEYIDVHQITKLFVESYLLSQYKEQKIGHLDQEKFEVSIITDTDVQKDIDEAIIYGEGINYARKLADTPANYMTPCHLVDEAKSLAKELGMECQILDKDALEEMKAGGILSVNQGSHIPAYMICLKYSQGGDMPYNAVVGKGITFDSGGYNLKGNSYGMKYDMCGAADVLGIMSILAKTKAKVNVYGIIPTTENLVSDKAYKPQDVITTLSGKTVEIVSTDAEGRLILCDALTYAQQLGVKRMIDLATLTGACVNALGDVYTGVFSNNDYFYSEFDEAMKNADEKGWRLPIAEEYFEKLKSSSADFKNSAGKPGGGASVAANFLEAFIDKDVEWIHLDIAGTADNNGTGATGAMIRSIVNMLKGD